MKRSTLLIIIVVLATLGLGDSLYLAHAALTDTALSCGIAGLDGCNIVAQSPYSRILFGIPNAVYGVLFYGAVLLLSAALLFVRHSLGHRLLLVLGAVSLVASLYFLYLQVFLIKAFCIYCLGSFVISVLLFKATFWLWRKERLDSPIEAAVLP